MTKHGNEKCDLTGQILGHLRVLSRSNRRKNTQICWNCVCVCGEHVLVRGYTLRHGRTKSCGCKRAEKTHRLRGCDGRSGHPLYNVWSSMRKRCSNSNHKSWARYGGRGIKVCKTWQNSKTFIAWALAHGWQQGLQLDRRNNDGNYSPQNCRFVTAKTNAQNRSPRKIRYCAKAGCKNIHRSLNLCENHYRQYRRAQ